MTIKITRLASRLMAMKYHTNKGGGGIPTRQELQKKRGRK